MKDEVARLRQQAQAAANSSQLQSSINRLEQQIQQVQGQLNQSRNELAQARQDLARKDDKIGQLSLREPLLVRAEWTGQADVDIFVQPDFAGRGGAKTPPGPDLNVKQHVFFAGETRTDCTHGPCGELWLMRDVVPNRDIRIFLSS